MRGDSAHIPSSSQTVGPYFRIGLEYLIDRAPALALDTPGTIELRGRVLDRDGAPVPDAVLEFWSAAVDHQSGSTEEPGAFPAGFRRVATNWEGSFSVVVERPGTPLLGDKRAHAPHILVLVFARGLLRHLISRLYLGDEPSNESDSILMDIPEERRATLIGRVDESQVGLYWWDVILQGTGETVFFAW
jgi:protocatechuate 3,4-dioxygenase, alpha subunit